VAKAKKAAGNRATRQPRGWPQCADLKPWLECYLDLSERHPRPDRAGILARTPLKQLAECGYETAALARLERVLGRLPPSECEATGFLALAGADICLDLPDRRRADRYLQLVEARQSTAQPRVRTALELNLKSLRAANDLPEPPGPSSRGDDGPLRRLGKYRQGYRAAMLAGDRGAAAKALHKAAKLIPEIDEFLLQPGLTLSTIRAFRRLGDDAALAKYLAWLDRNGHSNDLATGSLRAMGLPEVANTRAEKLVAGHLKKLKRDPDPNIHFPVDEICKELWFFLQTGQKETAARLLRRVLRELPTWPGLRGGFASSGVLTALAELLAEIDGPEAALELLGLAVRAGQAEPHRGFRRGALRAANQRIEAPGLATAIAQAGAIKNAKQRREALVPLLTRRAAWPELATLLDEITDADELLGSVKTVLFALPGGARLM
jgi:hypothetical protein